MLGACVIDAMERIKYKCLKLSEGPVKGIAKVFRDEVQGDYVYR